ncbi:hypothetical protein [Deinococcus piscis]|uniref:hypothetical protein n=1 Tax=Deinococcus piscis TaxID=394230 RepID=UPI001675FC80|nr:hypothetical protein [Deinococcus piscis]
MALVTLSLSGCSLLEPAKPIAYRASPDQMMNAIARLAPTLPVKPLNEPFRVTRRTADQLVVATPLKPVGMAVGLFVGAGIGNAPASITYNFKRQGDLTLVTSQVSSGSDLSSQHIAVYNMLDKTFTRVTLP